MNDGDGIGTFTDERDGQTYRTVKMPDGKVWMAQNLNYKSESGNSWYYVDDESMGEKYGILYDWKTAMEVSPTGWHLPSLKEWVDLMSAVGGEEIAGKKLKSKSGWVKKDDYGFPALPGCSRYSNGTDDYGFSALPGGMRYSCGVFGYAVYSGFWWTATEYGAGNAYYRGMGYCNDYVNERSYDKSGGLSVRCVADP